MIIFRSCTAFALALLVNSLSALTIPLNSQTLSNPSNTTLLSPSLPSNLSFPPEPFHYQIPPYYEAQISIIFNNYGPVISRHDTARTLLEAQVAIMREMARDPQHADLPVGRTRVFSYGSVTVTIYPQPELNHAYLGLWLAGAMQAGSLYGFVECQMQYVDERPIFGPAGFTLGWGSLEPS